MPDLCRIIKHSSLPHITSHESAIQQLYLAVRFHDADDPIRTSWIDLAIGVFIRNELPPSEDEVSLVESDVLAALIVLREKFCDVLMERCIVMDNCLGRKQALKIMREEEAFSPSLEEEIICLGDRINFLPGSGRLGFLREMNKD